MKTLARQLFLVLLVTGLFVVPPPQAQAGSITMEFSSGYGRQHYRHRDKHRRHYRYHRRAHVHYGSQHRHDKLRRRYTLHYVHRSECHPVHKYLVDG